MDSLPNFVTHGALLRALRARELRYNLRSITWTVHLKAQRLNLSYFYGLVVPSSRTEAGMKIKTSKNYYYYYYYYYYNSSVLYYNTFTFNW